LAFCAGCFGLRLYVWLSRTSLRVRADPANIRPALLRRPVDALALARLLGTEHRYDHPLEEYMHRDSSEPSKSPLPPIRALLGLLATAVVICCIPAAAAAEEETGPAIFSGTPMTVSIGSRGQC